MTPSLPLPLPLPPLRGVGVGGSHGSRLPRDSHGSVGVTADVDATPEPWRQAVAETMARRQAKRELRAQLAAARTAGKAIRHRERLRRLARQEEPEA